MEAYVAGDAEAFERLFRALGPPIHAFFVRSVGRGPVAEDLLQNTFLKLHVARRSWRRGEPLRPWLFTIAGRVRIDWLRRQGRVEAAGEVPLAEESGEDALADPEERGDPVHDAIGHERAERVQAALESLPEPQRVVVHLHRFEELGFAEIGRVLGISEGAAKLRAFRAYAQLRRALSDLVAKEPS